MALARFKPSNILKSALIGRLDPDLSGFDNTGGRPWQMVPVGGQRYLDVKVIGEEEWSIESHNRRIATVSGFDGGKDRNKTYRVDGIQRGTTFIIVRNRQGAELGRLEVGVKRQRSPSIRFVLVRDKTGRRTSTTADDVKAWLDYVNRSILLPQINVSFALDSIQEITVNEELGDPIDFGVMGDMPYVGRRTEGEKRWHAITESGDLRSGVFNVFCVWDFVHSGTADQFAAFVNSKVRITADEMARSGANYNMCIMKGKHDLRNQLGKTMEFYLDKHAATILAHEAGHYLEGFVFHYAPREGFHPLMRGDGLIGQRLLRRDADKMNP